MKSFTIHADQKILIQRYFAKYSAADLITDIFATSFKTVLVQELPEI